MSLLGMFSGSFTFADFVQISDMDRDESSCFHVIPLSYNRVGNLVVDDMLSFEDVSFLHVSEDRHIILRVQRRSAALPHHRPLVSAMGTAHNTFDQGRRVATHLASKR